MHNKPDVALDPQAQALHEQMNTMQAQAAEGDRILSPTQALVAGREAYPCLYSAGGRTRACRERL